MSRREERKGLAVMHDCLLQIPHSPSLLESKVQGTCESVETHGTIGMSRRAEREGLNAVHHCLL
jgi:hypothetical protein